MKPILLIAILALSACQTKAAGWRIVCDAPTRPEVKDAPIIERAGILVSYVRANVSNPEVMEVFDAIPKLPTQAERLKLMKTEIESVGIQKCAMLKYWKTKLPTEAELLEAKVALEKLRERKKVKSGD